MKIRFLHFILLLLLFPVLGFSQYIEEKEEQRQLKTRIDASYLFGGQVYNDNFIYNPGYSFQIINSLQIHKEFELGLGTGYTSLVNERFVPIYIETLGYKKSKKNSPFIKFQAGYSIGWDTETSAQKNYDMKGGFYFNAGVGRKIQVSERYSVLFHWSYCHQFASLEYEIFGGKDYSETVSYDMVQITFGLMMH